MNFRPSPESMSQVLQWDGNSFSIQWSNCRMKIRHDSSTDVERAVELLKKTEKDFDSRPFVVMESTGHYHKILFHSLYKTGFEVSVINPIQTDSIKNIGIRKVKNDKVDARKIALLYRFQELKTTNIPTRILNVCEAFAASTTSSLTNLLLTKQAYGYCWPTHAKLQGCIP